MEIFSGLATVIFKSNNNVLINDVEQFIVKAEEETEKAKEKVDDIINNKIYNEDNLEKFKKYLDDFYEEDSEETGILGFDETSFTYKYDDRTDRYTYNLITKKFNLIK